MTLSAGFLVGIPNIGKNLYLLWIPFLYAMDKAMQRWQRFGTAISLALSAAFLLIPWLVSLFYTGFAEPVSALNLIFPFIALILLYWNRWWTIQRIIEPY